MSQTAKSSKRCIRYANWGQGAVIGLGAAALFIGCSAAPLDDAVPANIGAARELGARGGLQGKSKVDGLEMVGLPVDGDYATSTVWQVTNAWEDTDTPAAREAGLAWPANSGLNWDQKYARWLASLPQIPHLNSDQQHREDWKTVEITTPCGKKLPAPVLDCADVALALRASFAAWYGLPFVFVAFDQQQPVYFGHFGIRTDRGIWNRMPQFATQYDDFSSMPPEVYETNWPRDERLRQLGVQPGDEQPMLDPPTLRTGAYLDEIHLNKRAAHMIRLLMIYTGSWHFADDMNTFNVTAEGLQPGEVMIHRYDAHTAGHTAVVVRVEEDPDVDPTDGGNIHASTIDGNLPPWQPLWGDPIGARRTLRSVAGGGAEYVEFNGGLKRFRVAKPIQNRWVNTLMTGDEVFWIRSDDIDRMRPATG